MATIASTRKCRPRQALLEKNLTLLSQKKEVTTSHLGRKHSYERRRRLLTRKLEPIL